VIVASTEAVGQTSHPLNKLKIKEVEKLLEPTDRLTSLIWKSVKIANSFTNSPFKFVMADKRNTHLELYDSNFIPFRGGSNWKRESDHSGVSRIARFTKGFYGIFGN